MDDAITSKELTVTIQENGIIRAPNGRLIARLVDDIEFENLENRTEPDTPKCEKCENRTALICGYFNYEPDDEPYKSGILEDAVVEGGEDWLGGYKCDVCGHIQNLWHE